MFCVFILYMFFVCAPISQCSLGKAMLPSQSLALAWQTHHCTSGKTFCLNADLGKNVALLLQSFFFFHKVPHYPACPITLLS